MSSFYTLSYVLTTYNKLAYLQTTLPRLVNARLEDEEIVVVDGGSTDGTKEFLSELYNQGKIQQFVSEKDFGEAHGTNKGFLMARGTLIKIITDDDVYSFKLISTCKKFMLDNPTIDLLGSNGFYHNSLIKSPSAFHPSGQSNLFLSWKKNRVPFRFTGLCLLFRKSSIPLLGLFDTNFVIVDYEYTLRVTAGKATLAWFTGNVYVNIVNPNSNSWQFWKKLSAEKRRLNLFYGLDPEYIQHYKIKIRSAISLKLKKLLGKDRSEENKFDFVDSFQKATTFLAKDNEINQGEFLI